MDTLLGFADLMIFPREVVHKMSCLDNFIEIIIILWNPPWYLISDVSMGIYRATPEVGDIGC